MLKDTRKHFLVVGDWFVDNYWVCAPQRSETASRTGESHIRALHDIDSSVRALCGAGEVASILALAEQQHTVTGIGHWHSGDTEHLRSLLFPQDCRGDNPFKVNPSIRIAGNDEEWIQRRARVNLFPLIEGLDSRVGTNRVWRIFEHTAGGYRHRTRIDWIQSEQHQLTPKQVNAAFDNVQKSQLPVSAVVVKDHAYGAVTADLIAALASKYQHVPWFVATKEIAPDWFSELPKERVELLLLPKELAATVPAHDGIPVHNWLIDGVIPSRGSMDVLEEYMYPRDVERSSIAAFQNSVIVAQHDVSEALALLANGKEGAIISSGSVAPDDESRFVPRASIFFGAAVHYRLTNPDASWAGILRESLLFSSQWAAEEKDRIRNPYVLHQNTVVLNDLEGLADPSTFEWNTVAIQWEQAHQNIGVVELKDGSKKLDLWRAKTELPGLIAIGREKRKLISDLCQELARFKRGRRNQSRSFYIGDDPGFGKSTLVEVLAKRYDFELVPIDITEVHKADDLSEYLQHIVAKHQKEPDRPILVFVDEFNAPVGGSDVPSWFLRPVENRQFHHHSETFVLPACVWIFAGTADLRRHRKRQAKVGEHPTEQSRTKVSDFVSRLNRPPYFLGSERSNDGNGETPSQDGSDRLALDRVYMGAFFITQQFTDVRRISEKVLTAFRMLPPDYSLRDIRNFVNEFSRVRRGCVTWGNVGQRLLDALIGAPGFESRGTDTTALVDIVIKPSDADHWGKPTAVTERRRSTTTTSVRPDELKLQLDQEVVKKTELESGSALSEPMTNSGSLDSPGGELPSTL